MLNWCDSGTFIRAMQSTSSERGNQLQRRSDSETGSSNDPNVLLDQTAPQSPDDSLHETTSQNRSTSGEGNDTRDAQDALSTTLSFGLSSTTTYSPPSGPAAGARLQNGVDNEMRSHEKRKWRKYFKLPRPVLPSLHASFQQVRRRYFRLPRPVLPSLHAPFQQLRRKYFKFPRPTLPSFNTLFRSAAGVISNLTHSEKLSWPVRLEYVADVLGIRSLLQAYHRIFRPNDQMYEKPQPIVTKSLFIVTFTTLIHAVPVSAVFIIYHFSSSGAYLGGDMPGPRGHGQGKEFGYQLAAKLHELTMIASLSAIIFTLIRYLLLTEHGLPFAGLSAGFRWTSISFLWSSDLWAIALSQTLPLLQRIFLVAVLAVCSLLGVSVGPASAVTMHPQRDLWPAGGATIWINSSIDRLFPLSLNETHVPGLHCHSAGTVGCPSESWESYKNWFLYPNRIEANPSPSSPYKALLPLGITVVAGEALITALIHPAENARRWTAATMPHVAIANALKLNADLWHTATRLSRDHDGTAYWDFISWGGEIRLYQPLVRVLCNATMYHSGSSSNIPYFPMYVRRLNSTREGRPSYAAQYQQWIEDDFHNETLAARLHWISGNPGLSGLEIETFGRLEAGALITLPSENTLGGEVISCSIMAKFVRGRRAYTNDLGAVNTDWTIVYDLSDSPENDPVTTKPGDRYSTLDPSWANYLNPYLPSLGSSVFEQICIIAGVWDTTRGAVDAPITRVESILAMMLVNGMANTDGSSRVQGSIKFYPNHTETGPWWREFMPRPQPGRATGHGGDPYSLTAEEKHKYVSMYVKMTIEGYANVMKSRRSVEFGMAILFVYAAMAMVCFLITVLTRRHSKAWESVNEVVALAFGSEPPRAALANTAGGIQTMRTLEHPVRVSVREGRLQLMVLDQDAEFEKVQVNSSY
jgi:hypothetical protein